jgi:hypothetical protein
LLQAEDDDDRDTDRKIDHELRPDRGSGDSADAAAFR